MKTYSFTINLAGIPIGIRTKKRLIRRFCRDYITGEEPLFTVESTEEDIAKERAATVAATGRENLNERMIERMWIYRMIAERLPAYDIFLIHASAAALDGRGVLFIGPSGAGKTTQTMLWQSVFGERLTVINDDKPLVHMTADGPVICGTPWSGKENLHTNTSVPLRAIIRLEQGKQNHIRLLPKNEAWDLLMNQVFRSRDAAVMKRTLALLDELITRTPVYTLTCTKDENAVQTAYEAIKNDLGGEL